MTENLIASIRNIPDFPKKGVLFKDITPLLGSAELFREAIRLLSESYRRKPVDCLAAIEARGFLLAGAMAERLRCGIVPLRKKGKLPYETHSITFDLEYGQDTLEIHKDAFNGRRRVAIVDDVLATGGTAAAAAALVEKAGGEIAAFSFLIEISPLEGRKKISRYPIHSLIQFG